MRQNEDKGYLKLLLRSFILATISSYLLASCTYQHSDMNSEEADYIAINDTLQKKQILAGFINYYSESTSGYLIISQKQKFLNQIDTSYIELAIRYDQNSMSPLNILFDIVKENHDSVRMSYNGGYFFFLSRNSGSILKWSGKNEDIVRTNSSQYFRYLPIFKPEKYSGELLKNSKLFQNDEHYLFINDVGFQIYLTKKNLSLRKVIENLEYNGNEQYLEIIIEKQEYGKDLGSDWILDERSLPDDYTVIDNTLEDPNAYGISTGNDAPEIDSHTIDNKGFNLESLRGEVVLLDFWYIGCIPCKKSIPALLEIETLYKDVHIVGINPVDRDIFAIKKYLSENKIDFLQIHDVEKIIKDAYEIVLFPTLILIDQKGKIVKVYNGLLEDQKSDLMSQIDTLLGRDARQQGIPPRSPG